MVLFGRSSKSFFWEKRDLISIECSKRTLQNSLECVLTTESKVFPLLKRNNIRNKVHTEIRNKIVSLTWRRRKKSRVVIVIKTKSPKLMFKLFYYQKEWKKFPTSVRLRDNFVKWTIRNLPARGNSSAIFFCICSRLYSTPLRKWYLYQALSKTNVLHTPIRISKYD